MCVDKIDEILDMWKVDCKVNELDAGRALLDIPLLHHKYSTILYQCKRTLISIDIKLNKIKKLKREYYTGKLDENELKERGWEPFPYVLKSDISLYMESDDDINAYVAKKRMYTEIISLCESILKELNSRTYQLRAFIDYTKFMAGA